MPRRLHTGSPSESIIRSARLKGGRLDQVGDRGIVHLGRLRCSGPNLPGVAERHTGGDIRSSRRDSDRAPEVLR